MTCQDCEGTGHTVTPDGLCLVPCTRCAGTGLPPGRVGQQVPDEEACPSGHPADGQPCTAYQCERLGGG